MPGFWNNKDQGCSCLCHSQFFPQPSCNKMQHVRFSSLVLKNQVRNRTACITWCITSCFLGVPLLANISAPFLAAESAVTAFTCRATFSICICSNICIRLICGCRWGWSRGVHEPLSLVLHILQGFQIRECNLSHTNQHSHFTEDHIDHLQKLIGEMLWDYANTGQILLTLVDFMKTRKIWSKSIR